MRKRKCHYYYLLTFIDVKELTNHQSTFLSNGPFPFIFYKPRNSFTKISFS